MHIRPALEGDLAAVQALYDEVPYLIARAPHLVREGHIHVAEINGTVAGFSICLPGGFFWAAVNVVHRRQGIGRALLDHAIAQASEAGVTEFTSQVAENLIPANAFCARFGFVPFIYAVHLILDLAQWDDSQVEPALERARSGGIHFKTFAELGDSPENRQRLYQLNKALSATIPRDQPLEFAPFDTYIARRLTRASFPQDGIFIALDGDEWIGMAQISLEDEFAFNHMTGVLPAYRNRGIAQALKGLSIRFAKRSRSVLRTFNDVSNPPMIAVNEKAGFRQEQRFHLVRRKPLVQAP